MKKIYAALTEGGSLILYVPTNDVWHLPPVRKLARFLNISRFEHETLFSMPKVEVELKQAGFSMAELSPWFYVEGQLEIALPRRVYSLPLIGEYLVGSVNIRAIKKAMVPRSPSDITVKHSVPCVH